MKSKLLRSTGITSLFVFITSLLFTGCKKDSHDGGGGSSEYYLTATVDGKAWTANVKSTLNNAPAIAATTSSGSVSILFLVGINAVGNDSTAIILIFPQNVEVSKTISFDATKYSEGGYIAETAPGATTYYSYNSTPATDGSGSFMITTFDQTNKLIEGTFSGTFGSQTSGRSAIQITNGKFRCPYTADVNQLPKSGGVKF
ncbi:MAG: hypothetical protein QM764_01355 [Chitinophagaceae bacterium]